MHRVKLNGRLGDLGHTGMGRSEGKHLRSVHGEDAVLHIPGTLERDAAGLRARYHTHGTRGRYAQQLRCPLRRSSNFLARPCPSVCRHGYRAVGRPRVRQDSNRRGGRAAPAVGRERSAFCRARAKPAADTRVCAVQAEERYWPGTTGSAHRSSAESARRSRRWQQK